MDEGSHVVMSIIMREVPDDVELGNATGEMSRGSIMDRWAQVYGRPKIIRTDPDVALLSRASVDFFGEFGIQLM
eukprot:15239629-Alexandrium_andersonii.AAC.1